MKYKDQLILSSNMKDARQIIEEFWYLAESRCAFNLKNGSHLEGYILEVEDENIVFGSGGPLASDKDEYIPIEEIDLTTLYFWSDAKQCHVNARWDAEQNEWLFIQS